MAFLVVQIGNCTNDPGSPTPASPAGTLGDYSDDLYRHFFEVPDRSDIAEGVFLEYLGREHSARLRRVENGYELLIPIQCAPELVRLLTNDDVAVYQLVRLEKSEAAR